MRHGAPRVGSAVSLGDGQVPQATDAFGARFDASGDRLWATFWGGAGDDGGRLQVEADRGLRLYGFFAQQATFGDTSLEAEGQDALLLVLEPATGDPLEAEALGVVGKATLDGGRRFEASEILIGSFGGTLDLGGELLESDALDLFITRRAR